MTIPFRLVSRELVDLADLKPTDIKVEDIACALSKICRFTGHIREFYSVAQHAVMVAELVDPALRFAALHHDDSEAYIGDVSRYLKHSEYLSGYRTLEERIQTVINHELGIVLSKECREHIKAADDLVAVYEQYVLRRGLRWEGEAQVYQAVGEGYIKMNVATVAMAAKVPPSWTPFIPLLPAQAEQLFLFHHDQESQS